MNGGGWYELRTEEDRQARLENCCDGWSGQYRYIPGTFKDEAVENRKIKYLFNLIEAMGISKYSKIHSRNTIY